jgi:hypothetical protein
MNTSPTIRQVLRRTVSAAYPNTPSGFVGVSQLLTTSRPVMNSPSKDEARDRANTAPLQSHPGDQRRGLTGQSSGPEAAQPVIATAPNQFRGATNPPGAMSAITGSADGCPFSEAA